jgi:putative MFS transporter
LFGFGATAMIVLTAYMHDVFLGAASLFWLLMIVTYFFAEGSFAIVGPYAAEVWPAGLRTTGMGAAYGFGGIGKIIGPLGLALIVGSSNVVKPDASAAMIVPAFVYLAAWYLLAGVVYLFFGMETKGRSIEEIDRELAPARVARPLTFHSP